MQEVKHSLTSSSKSFRYSAQRLGRVTLAKCTKSHRLPHMRRSEKATWRSTAEISLRALNRILDIATSLQWSENSAQNPQYKRFHLNWQIKDGFRLFTSVNDQMHLKLLFRAWENELKLLIPMGLEVKRLHFFLHKLLLGLQSTSPAKVTGFFRPVLQLKHLLN